jgi:restriction endonuclease S subunit
MSDSWAEVTLGDIATIVPGKYLPKSEYVEDGDYFVYGSNSVMGKYSKFLIEPPHTVMAAIGAYAGAVRYSPRPSWVNNNAFGLLVKPAALPGYLFLWLNSMLDLSTVVAGTGQPYVQRPSLNATKVPLPPLSDQKRIVDVINSVDTYIAALQQQAVDARSARNAVLHGQLAMRDNWTEVTLGELTASTRPICYGVLKPGPHIQNGVPLVRITDMDQPELGPAGMHRISAELDHEFRRSRLSGNEVLLSIQGTVGKVSRCGPSLVGGNISRTIALIDCDSRLMNNYLAYYLEWLSANGKFNSSGSTRDSLNISEIRTIAVPVPPLAEQKRIVETVTAMDDVVGATEQALRVAQELRSGLLSTLLSGEHEIPEAYDRLLGAA